MFRRTISFPGVLVLLALSAPLGSGCGVARSTTAIMQAQQRQLQAKGRGADATAPYEYTLGVEFLRKAREEAGYSDYQVAERLAVQSRAYFAEAERQTNGRREEPKAGTGETE